MLEDFSKKLESDVLIDRGYGITDSVNDVIFLARSKARENRKSEFGVKDLLLALLENPGENIRRGMSKYDIDRKNIIDSIKLNSPALFQKEEAC
ncbi:MAG: hypothetical protein AYK18_07850 [Theionarchaea archaeon DG-70]|nr:MAG: hypothetical protein AYK18_07850 [Theionarchaea archaeon DG-70]MBU7026935.1 hypothetical protein [Theionarchaea archaeon]